LGEYISIKKGVETAILVGLINQTQNEQLITEYLNELEFLALTANAKVAKRYIQRMEGPNPKTFIGTGKIQEIKEYVNKEKIDMIIFDDELSATQQRNIEKIINGSLEKANCKILDRNNLILDIFASRARTAHAKTQVELAQYQYILPRLTRMWTHLERQKGGIGLRGPGETELETDRRIIRDKISRLKEKLKKIDKQKATQRKSRSQLIRVALVGYTNVGKSTLMNLISKSDVFAENKLFATLDTTIRKVTIGNLPFLLSDTVGFIRKLPHLLIESFKSTLDEVREADVLLHVVDVAHPKYEEHIQVVTDTLKEINVIDKPIVFIFNKIDLFPDSFDPEFEEENTTNSLRALKSHWMNNVLEQEGKHKHQCLFISATKKQNIEEFREVVYGTVKQLHAKRYPYNNFLY
jgi:GTP-binding protein HflX